MNAWFAEIAIGLGASSAAMLLVKATLTLAVALAVTGLARRSRAAARHVLLVALVHSGEKPDAQIDHRLFTANR